MKVIWTTEGSLSKDNELSFSTIKKLFRLFDRDKKKVRTWLESPNVLLGGYSPYLMLVAGRGDKLKKFIDCCIEEHYA